MNGFDPAHWLSHKQVRQLDRVSQLAVAATQEALLDAGLLDENSPPDTPALLDDIDLDRVAISLGTGIGGVATLEHQMTVRTERGTRRVSPFTVPMTMPNAPAAALSLRYGIRGSAWTITTACASGTDAIAAGARLVADGRADVVIAGGADHSLTPTCIAGFENMGALSPTGLSRPFDSRRDGLAAAEGSGILILEPLEAARARGERIYMTVLGAASCADAHHITSPAPRGAGAVRCMREALDDADLEPSDIAHINAHGTSTPPGDLAEAQAIETVFGTHRPPTTSIKGVTGHSFGAAGGLEAVAVALTVAHRTLPPTVGHVVPDPQVNADIVAEPRDWTPGPVLSNSFGFGGHNASVVLAPVQEDA
ncbi:beta-ketoacyl-[acyl-carrier-protein] synthase family protein [Streptomyces parvulus]|uniref:beta-ketoacyl-[acyl-carrier-protein] synthase family protein n=1 Tax=Streptomyces parvulus TaxID=146923 RepID=UPI00339FADAD